MLLLAFLFFFFCFVLAHFPRCFGSWEGTHGRAALVKLSPKVVGVAASSRLGPRLSFSVGQSWECGCWSLPHESLPSRALNFHIASFLTGREVVPPLDSNCLPGSSWEGPHKAQKALRSMSHPHSAFVSEVCPMHHWLVYGLVYVCAVPPGS